jgi:hypothetical protein
VLEVSPYVSYVPSVFAVELTASVKISFAQGNFSAPSINFSKATKLKEVTLKFYRCPISWAVSALKTITSSHRDLQRISIYFPFSARDMVDQDTYDQWRDLDRILVHLWESHAIRVNPLFGVGGEQREGVSEWAGALLPEANKRGMIEMFHSAKV